MENFKNRDSLENKKLETKEQVGEYSLDLIESHLENLGISQANPYDISKIDFTELSMLGNGSYSIGNDKTTITPAFWFDLGTITHELVHASSSSWRNSRDPKNKNSGFSGHFLLNEGTTELITQDIIKSSSVEVGQISDLETEKIIQKMRQDTADTVRDIRKGGGKILTKLILDLHKADEENLRSKSIDEERYKTEVEIIKVILDRLVKDFAKKSSLSYENSYLEVWNDWQRDYFGGDVRSIEKKIRSVFDNITSEKLMSSKITTNEREVQGVLKGLHI